MFHAAVSGNGVSDLSSSYLSVGWSYALPNYWRFEHDQCRMGYIFNNWEHYDRNSAVRFADKVTTPLLSWIGENDDQVNPFQSYEFHIALRRLGKRGLLITYPGEGHVIIDPYKQKDLSIKVMEWFDHYLKDKPEPGWCKPN
ncbi:alpha/beta hydrolase family protein [Flavobacterium psychrotrophum]|uniref:alpha/beta hydrolase family protein n=1 Tax=Flavobacterium psychrotrophum TaxID=2294119 RepID=UPI001F092914|nr:prolyl oligopeptidase family serine peptidase [Flavobacterium psychrotrophum]